MKSLFYNIGEFMYRTPTDTNNEFDYLEEIQCACKSAEFIEKISIASPSLVDMLNTCFNTPKQLSTKKLNSLQISIMKYIIRSKTRTTPFGLFVGVGGGTFGNTELYPKKQITYQKKPNVDSEWLFGFIEYLEKNCPDKLKFKLNDACYIKGNRAVLVYSVEKETEEISIRFTNVFKIIFDFIQEYQSYDDIINIIQREYKEVPADKIVAYIGELISKGFLISKLRPSFNNSNPLVYFIEECKKAELYTIVNDLNEIKKLCSSYMETKIGKGTKLHNVIISKMKVLHKSPAYLQIDTIIENGKMQINREVAKIINETASLFVYMSNEFKSQYTYLREYKNKFLEKYGVDREVPLLEMIDSGIGIGAPENYIKPQNDFYEEHKIKDNYKVELRDYFLDEYEKALENGTSININFNEIEKYSDCSVDFDEVPVSIELYFLLKKINGEMNLYLGPNCGAFAAGKTFGRFSVLSDDFARILELINSEERKLIDKNTEMCEINFLPSPVRNGNVVRGLSFREKETAIFINGEKNIEDCISLKDIYIGISNEKFYAKDRKTGKFVVFESNNMYNPMLNPNALRFLQDISYDGKRSWSEFPWNYIYANYRHVPAIKYKNVVLENEKWRLNLKEMALERKNFQEFQDKFQEIKIQRKMPSVMYISEVDNRIKIHFNQKIGLRIVFDEMKKDPEKDVIFEKIEDGEDIIYDDGKPYMTEIVVPLFKKKKEETRIYSEYKQSVDSDQHLAVPFDQWLYMKLYCNYSREEELIAFDIMDFCEEIKKKYGIEYFFMRYADPKPHIRLRLHGEESVLLQAYPEVMVWCVSLFTSKIVGDINIAVYDREIERYGGLQLIGIAEKLFFEDSYIVEGILRMKRLGILSLEQDEIGVISVIMYVLSFYDTYEKQLQFLTLNYHSSNYMDEYKKKKEKISGLCDFEHNWEKLCERKDGKLLYDVLLKRQSIVEIYRNSINKVNSDPVFKNGIVASVIHLHCNRLIGTDRELERKLMAFAESVFYGKKYIIKRIEENEGK